MTALARDPMTDYLVEQLDVLPNLLQASDGDMQSGANFGLYNETWWYYSSEWASRVAEPAPTPGVPWADNIGYGSGFTGFAPVPNYAPDGWHTGSTPHAPAPSGVLVGTFESCLTDDDLSTYVELRSNVNGTTYAALSYAHELVELQFSVHGEAAAVDPLL